MCGIVGYICTRPNELQNARRGFFRYALMLDTLRGPDSTGVISVDKKFTVRQHHSMMPGFRMVNTNEFFKIPNGWACIGHNRAATSGSVSLKNAHPFKFGKVTMVHNGTLSDDGKSLDTYDKNLNVDSMQIALALSSVPVKDASKILEQLKGAYALVWTDERDRSINMARNGDRPLHLGFNVKRELLMFMSDDAHLEVITKQFRGTPAAIGAIYSVDKYQILKWKRGSLCPEVIAYDPFRHTQIYMGAHSQIPIGASQQTTTSKTETKNSTTKSSKTRGWKRGKENRTSTGTPKKENGPRIQGLADVEPVIPSLSLNRTIPSYKGSPLIKRTNTEAMVKTVEEMFKCSVNDWNYFWPEQYTKVAPNLYRVEGEAVNTGWGKSMEWPAIIPLVTSQQLMAHKDRAWVVRFVGVCNTAEYDDLPGLMCDLVHCDWDKYEKQMEDARERENERKNIHDGDLMQDPDGVLRTRTQVSRIVEDGCVNCGDEILPQYAFEAEYCNDGANVICRDCALSREFKGAL